MSEVQQESTAALNRAVLRATLLSTMVGLVLLLAGPVLGIVIRLERMELNQTQHAALPSHPRTSEQLQLVLDRLARIETTLIDLRERVKEQAK